MQHVAELNKPLCEEEEHTQDIPFGQDVASAGRDRLQLTIKDQLEKDKAGRVLTKEECREGGRRSPFVQKHE